MDLDFPHFFSIPKLIPVTVTLHSKHSLHKLITHIMSYNL
jgi:hypothetical protein